MQKVLLAINGMNPSYKVFVYAVDLCRRMNADLCVLQVVDPKRYVNYFKRLREKARRARRFFEDSMTALTFAEAGEQGLAQEITIAARKNMNALLPESEKAGVSCHLAMKSGNPSNEIVRYVNEHRDVVLTVYDDADRAKIDRPQPADEKDIISKIKHRLSMPMVVLKETPLSTPHDSQKKLLGG